MKSITTVVLFNSMIEIIIVWTALRFCEHSN